MAKKINVDRVKRSRKLEQLFSDPCYQFEPATDGQLRALSFMVERASKREFSLDPDIPLSKYDIAQLFSIFKGQPPRGAKIATARLLRRLSEAGERAGNWYTWRLNDGATDIIRIEPTEHPLYKSAADLEREAIARHHERVLDDLADEWALEDERVEHQAAVNAFLDFDCEDLTDVVASTWDDQLILDEIKYLDHLLPGIECPYKQHEVADRMAALHAQLEV